MRATSGERDALRAQLSQVLARLDATRRAIERQELELTDLQARVEELSGRMEALQEQVNRRAAQVYTSGAGGGLELLLGTTSFRDLQDVAGFLARMAQSDRDAITALTTQRVELGRRRAAVDALRAKLGSARAGLDAAGRDLTRRLGEQQAAMARLAQQRQEAEALVGRLASQREQELARQRIDATSPTPPGPSPAPPPSPSPTPSPDPQPGYGPEAVKDLIRQYFGPLGGNTVDIALCVAGLESDFNPSAVNPYSGAAGVYQFLPSTWDGFSRAAGWSGASVFDARANVAVAAWAVTNFGWSSWSADGPACGF